MKQCLEALDYIHFTIQDDRGVYVGHGGTGSISYSSPELIFQTKLPNAVYTPKCDIWALACSFVFLVQGHHVFPSVKGKAALSILKSLYMKSEAENTSFY